MKNPATKLIMAGASLGLAVILLVGTSLAWFSISAKPEISSLQVTLNCDHAILLSADGTHFGYDVNLSDAFANLAPLKPVSTYDGENWFLPTYSETGVLNDPSEFILDNTLAHGNVSLVDEDGNPLPDNERGNAREQGYYVYTDFWMKTEEEGCWVTLSVPSALRGPEDWELEDARYGTYVLSNYEVKESMDASGTTHNVVFMDTAAQNCVRVGFLIESDEVSEFLIYEPNADVRSSFNKPHEGDDFSDSDKDLKYTTEEDYKYVVGFDYSQDGYSDGVYYFTRPIVKDEISAHLASDEEVDLLLDKTLIQKESTWKDNATIQSYYTANGKLDSNVVDVMGRFLDPADLISDADDAGGPTADADGNPLTRSVSVSSSEESLAGVQKLYFLTRDNPVKVRLFIWIEGQDVDCWNDIAAGSFVINMEMTGEVVVPDEEE